MKKVTLILFLFISVLIVFISCDKDENNINNENVIDLKKTSIVNDLKIPTANVIDGVLYLDANTAKELACKLADMPEKEFKNWENQMGFKSLRTVADEIHEKLSKCKSKEEYLNIVSSNSDIVTIDEDNNLIMTIDCKLYNSICNKDGIYYINDVMHKITPEYLFTSKSLNLRTMNSNDLLRSSSDNLKKIKWKNFNNSKLKSESVQNKVPNPTPRLKQKGEAPYSPTCSGIKAYDKAELVSLNGKRKVKVEMSLQLWGLPVGNDYHQAYFVDISVRSYKKVFGQWDWYNTEIWFHQAGWQASGPYIYDYNWTLDETVWHWTNYSRSNWSGYEADDDLLQERDWIDPYEGELENCEEELPAVNNFCKYQVKASHRGMGEGMEAKLCYGFSNCGTY